MVPSAILQKNRYDYQVYQKSIKPSFGNTKNDPKSSRKSEVLEKVLLKPPKVTFMNPKTLKKTNQFNQILSTMFR